MLGEHDSNVGVPLTAGQEERCASLLGTTLDVGVAGDQQLSQLKEPFLCGQSEWALPGRGREGEGKLSSLFPLCLPHHIHNPLLTDTHSHQYPNTHFSHLLLGKGVEGLQP